MSFQIKDFVSIAASMINHAKATQDKITDFNVGSVARTLLESSAIEIDELYQQMFFGLMDAIPIATYLSFGFELLAAEAGSGVVRFSCITPPVSDVLIPAGTSVRAPAGAYKYSSLNDAVLSAGETYVDVIVYCDAVGQATNAQSGTIKEIITNVAGVDSVSNPYNFLTGRDAETEDERKTRFHAYISSLSRGTSSAITYGAKLAALKDVNGVIIEDVHFVKVVEPYLTDVLQPIGLAVCYIHNGVNGASSELVAETQKIIDGYRMPDGTPVVGWKSAGVVVNVIAASETAVNVTASVSVDEYYDGASVRAEVLDAIFSCLSNTDIGISISTSEIIAAAMKVSGVTSFSLTLPSGNVAVSYNNKITPGLISLT